MPKMPQRTDNEFGTALLPHGHLQWEAECPGRLSDIEKQNARGPGRKEKSGKLSFLLSELLRCGIDGGQSD